MSDGQMPPWLQEKLLKLQQAQQSLQSIQLQKRQLDAENAESGRALDELKKAADGEVVYKHAGSILIRSDRDGLVSEIEERQELSGTRSQVLKKQEERIVASIREQETKINEMIKGVPPGAGQQAPPKTDSA